MDATGTVATVQLAAYESRLAPLEIGALDRSRGVFMGLAKAMSRWRWATIGRSWW